MAWVEVEVVLSGLLALLIAAYGLPSIAPTSPCRGLAEGAIVETANEGDTVGLLFTKPVAFDVLVPGVVFERV